MTETPYVSVSEARLQEERAEDRATIFGFWVYLMTDLVLFASLFATYAVLHVMTTPGTLPHASLSTLAETVLLLTSSLACGFSLLWAQAGERGRALAWAGATLTLGAAFLALELAEFRTLMLAGHGPQASGVLSAFFTLVGTHGLHILVGLLWGACLMGVIASRGLTRKTLRALSLWSMFWHFLDIVWIFIFTLVYLLP